VTNVIAAHGNVTITGPSQPVAQTSPALPTATTASPPQTAIELAEECARLRRDNQRLSSEVVRLRDEVSRLTASSNPTKPPREQLDLDDTARRFALLELE